MIIKTNVFSIVGFSLMYELLASIQYNTTRYKHYYVVSFTLSDWKL